MFVVYTFTMKYRYVTVVDTITNVPNIVIKEPWRKIFNNDTIFGRIPVRLSQIDLINFPGKLSVF